MAPHNATLIQSIIERGQRENLFRGLDARVLAIAFLTMHSNAYQWLQPTGRLSPAEIAQLFSDVFIRGIEFPEAIARERSEDPSLAKRLSPDSA